MAIGKNTTTGRFDKGSFLSIQNKVSAPRFVDNAVRHAVYSKVKQGFGVSSPVSDDFMTTHERKYKLIEQEDTIKLLHNPTNSFNFEGPIFNDKAQVNSSHAKSILPPLFMDSEGTGQAIIPETISSAFVIQGVTGAYHAVDTGKKSTALGTGNGSSFKLANMKGKSLTDIGFTSRIVQIGQKVSVGLRTSDLAMRVVTANPSAINSFITKEHSNIFIAQDFYGVDATSALRFISKHDGYSPRTDHYGNLQYVSQNRFNKEHLITEARTRGFIENQAESVPNRAIVRGQSRANNDDNTVQVDDFGSQENGVNEVPGGIYAPTAITKASARKIGQRMLRMAKSANNGIIVKGVISATNMHPGDALTYHSLSQSHRQIIIGSHHDLINKTSDLSINSVEASLEDILQRSQEVDVSGSYEANMDRNRQFTVEEFSTSVGFKMKVTWEISERVDENRKTGFTIGELGRNIVHGKRNYKATAAFSTAAYAVDYMNAAPIVGTGLKVKAGGASYGATATYTNLATTGGTGSNLKVNITTVDNVITTAVVHTAGSGYALNDVVTVASGSGGQLLLTSTVIIDDGAGSGITAIAIGSGIYRSNGALLGTVGASTTTSVTFDAGINHKLENNERLLILGTASNPENANRKIKIGANYSKYLRNRRG